MVHKLKVVWLLLWLVWTRYLNFVGSQPGLDWFGLRDWKSNHLLLRFDFNWVSAQFNLVWVKLRVVINLLVIWTWNVLSLWVTQCGCLDPFGHTGHFGPLFGIWYTLSYMDTVGHFGHTFGLVWKSSLDLILMGLGMIRFTWSRVDHLELNLLIARLKQARLENATGAIMWVN